MKLKTLLIAACMGFTSQAHALAVSDLSSGTIVTLFIAGAPGLIVNFDAVMNVPGTANAGARICANTTTTKYTDPGGSTVGGSSNMIAYFCTASSSLGFPAGTKLLIYFRGSGGSLFGVDPVGKQDIHYYKLSATAGCGNVPSGKANCTNWKNKGALSGDYVTGRPDVGFSLVEPRLFIAPSPNVPSDPTICSNNDYFGDACPAGAGNTFRSSRPVLVQATVLAVNKALRDMLFAMQFSGLDLGQVPSLTRAEARSLFTEGNQLSNGSLDQPNWSHLSTVMSTRFPSGTPFSGDMTLCRGVPGLGTVAAFNAVLLNNPCATGIPQGATLMVESSVDGITISQANPVSAVLTCTQNATTPAIGLLTLDQLAAATNAGLSFINIDGYPMKFVPNAQNPTTAPGTVEIDYTPISTGQYELWSEAYYQISSTLTSGSQPLILANALQTALLQTTPGPGVFNVALPGAGTSRPMKVTRGGNSCSPALFPVQ